MANQHMNVKLTLRQSHAHDEARRLKQSQRMNARSSRMAKPRSRHN